jgi:hypothetical protein
MTHSEQINEIAAALAKAQAVMVTASKDSTNPHFKSRYADLASVRDACRPLADVGIAVVQGCRTVTEDGLTSAEVETRFLHTSGQWVADVLRVPVSKVDAQGCASAMTYARRIGLAGLAGLAPADDDGEAAVGRTTQPANQPAKLAPKGYDAWKTDMAAVADNGAIALASAWKESRPDYRTHLIETEPLVKDGWKAKAAARDAENGGAA